MQKVNISEFRANLLKYLQMAGDGQKISVTSNGEVLATVSSPEDAESEAKQQLARIAETASIYDVTSPVDTEWDAE